MQLSLPLQILTPQEQGIALVGERLKKKRKCKTAAEYTNFILTTEMLKKEMRQ